MRFQRIILWGLLFASAGLVQAAPPGDSLFATRTTLAGWQNDLRLMLLDRAGSYGGVFNDRGVFRLIARPLDDELDLDLLTFRFTPTEDYRWYAADHAFRSWAGSFNTANFLTQNHLRHRVDVTPVLAMRLEAVQQYTRRSERFFFEPGLTWQARPGHSLTVSNTLMGYKPDLDLTLSYRYARDGGAGARFDVTFLDWANNFIFDRLGVHHLIEDTARSYRSPPVLTTVHLVSPPAGAWRAEAAGGLQPASRAHIQSQYLEPGLTFEQRERAAYAGLLVEFAAPHLAAGLTYQTEYSHSARGHRPEASVPIDYSVAQHSQRLRAHVITAFGPWRAEASGFVERNVDEQRGTAFGGADIAEAFRFDEVRYMTHLRLMRLPRRNGPIAGTEWVSDHRGFRSGREVVARYVDVAPVRYGARISAIAGYRVNPRTMLLAGAGYDVDGDTDRNPRPVRFDSGYLRIVTVW
jgi:hypothetical protein